MVRQGFDAGKRSGDLAPSAESKSHHDTFGRLRGCGQCLRVAQEKLLCKGKFLFARGGGGRIGRLHSLDAHRSAFSGRPIAHKRRGFFFGNFEFPVARRCNGRRAADYVFGYVCLKDISDRSTQVDAQRQQHLERAKSRPTYCPIGPYLMTGIDPMNPIHGSWRHPGVQAGERPEQEMARRKNPRRPQNPDPNDA